MRAVLLLLALLAVNCAGRQVVTSPAMPKQIRTIIDTDVKAMPAGPQRERIRRTLETAASEIELLHEGIGTAKTERDEAREQLSESRQDADKWAGAVRLLWLIGAGVAVWAGWRLFRWLRPGLPV